MRNFYLFLLSVLFGSLAKAQSPDKKVLLLLGDSVKVTYCDSAELIIENHTQNVPGFLFNTGNGRTIFKRALIKINDTSYVIGADTLRLGMSGFWALKGNAGTNPAVNFIGTTDTSSLSFRTWNDERMRLFSNGNLGIGRGGIADNGYKLNVVGNLKASGNSHMIGNMTVSAGMEALTAGSACGIRIDNNNGASFMLEGSTQGVVTDMFTFTSSGGNFPKSQTYVDGSIVRILSGFNGANVANLSGNTLHISPTYNVNIPTAYGLTFRGIYYNPLLGNLGPGGRHIAVETVSGDVLLGTSSGNTGIGTNAPSAQLHTTGTVRFAGLTNDNTQARLVVSDANGNLFYRTAGSLVPGAMLNTLPDGSSVLSSSLAVRGEVRAERLRLSQDKWPDYVFAGSYVLPTLPQVEAFIQMNGHLPEIPSAAEVQKNGVDVGSTEAALLRKIEELTLYIIAQNKEMESMKTAREKEKKDTGEVMRRLEERLNKLENR